MRLALCFVASLGLAGCAAQPARVDPFTGLLPQGTVPRPAKDAADPGLLRHQRLTIVASANLEAYTRQWADYYERGGAERQDQTMQGLMQVLGQNQTTQGMATGIQQGLAITQQHGGVVRQASDPRNITDAAVLLLSPYFESVSAAPDLASAREAGADVIAVVDYYGRWHPPGLATRYEAYGGIHLLDADLSLLLSVTSYDDRDREGDCLTCMPATIVAGTKTTLERSIVATVQNLRREVHRSLHAPPAGR
jgi:hypothetical protein